MNQPLTPEQTESAYQRACKQECELCRNGRAIIPEGEPYAGWHIVDAPHSYRSPCTAPSKEAFMERQAAQIAAMQAALAKASHHRDCNTNGLICKNCDKWFREHGIATDACPDRDSVFEEVRGCCNCYLSTLSDDVERGKELLVALKDKDRLDWLSGNWIVISPSGDENQSPNRWIVDAAWADTEASAAGTLREAIDMERGELAKLKGETK